jgi:hypothetical protein
MNEKIFLNTSFIGVFGMMKTNILALYSIGEKIKRITYNSIMNYAKRFAVRELNRDWGYFVPVEL